MNKELKDRWLTALRSGTYHQGMACLRDSTNRFCCLGVLADLVDPAGWNKEGTTDAHQVEWGLDEDNLYLPAEILAMPHQWRLSGYNDKGNTFEELALWIEKNVEPLPEVMTLTIQEHASLLQFS